MQVFKNEQEVKNYCSENKKTYMIYKDQVLDVTEFAGHHPGGAHLLTYYHNVDITPQMDSHQPLSSQLADSLCVGTLSTLPNPKPINPHNPLLPQIWSMDHQTYMNNVHTPYWAPNKSPRMFATSLMEAFSFCSWYNIFYVPYLIMAFYYYRYAQHHWQPISLSRAITVFIFGIFIFSLTEYLLHRFIFHSEKKLMDSRLLRTSHFILHGIHHMFPLDPFRLVLPPLFTGLVILLGYFTVYQLTYWPNPADDWVFWTGFLTGYIMYDITHYAIHHIDTSKKINTFFHHIQQHHNQHHYGGEDAGYGVSTPFWDHIFRTLYLKKRKH